MQISLSPEMERFVREKVTAGTYTSADEVVQDALVRLREADTRQEIPREELSRIIAVGQAESDRGEVLDARQVFDELRSRSAERRGRTQ